VRLATAVTVAAADRVSKGGNCTVDGLATAQWCGLELLLRSSALQEKVLKTAVQRSWWLSSRALSWRLGELHTCLAVAALRLNRRDLQLLRVCYAVQGLVFVMMRGEGLTVARCTLDLSVVLANTWGPRRSCEPFVAVVAYLVAYIAHSKACMLASSPLC
jgi:hypothetical protein